MEQELVTIFSVGEKPKVCRIRFVLALISVLIFTNVVVPDVAVADRSAQGAIKASTSEIATMSGVVLPQETTPGAVTPSDPITTEPAATMDVHGQRERLDVPLHPQFPTYPSGCEAASVSMLVSYATGKNISVDNVVANTKYRGNPREWSAYTVPDDMLSPIRHYVGKAKNLSGVKLSTVKKYINQNKPVVVWVRMPDVGFHCICVVGYSKTHIYYNDPWRGSIGGKDKKVKTATFERWWSSLHRWAVSY